MTRRLDSSNGLDSEVIGMPQGSLRNITLTLRDAYGVPVRLVHYVLCEIRFLENPSRFWGYIGKREHSPPAAAESRERRVGRWASRRKGWKHQ